MSDSGEDSDVESSKKPQAETATPEIETSSGPRRTTRRTRQRTQLYKPGEGESPPKKRKRKSKVKEELEVMKKEKKRKRKTKVEDEVEVMKEEKEREEVNDSDKGDGNDSSGDDDEDSIRSPHFKEKGDRKPRASLARNLSEADLTCAHCQKVFTVKPGLDYHVENFVCQPTLRPGGPVVKGKRKKSVPSGGGGTKSPTYARIRGKLDARICPKCKRVFTSILGLSYHVEKLVCEQVRNKTEGTHGLLYTLEPGSQFVTPYGVVEVVKDDRAFPTGTEIPKKMADLSKAWNSSQSKQQVQIRKMYSMVAVKSLLRRSHLHDYYAQNLTTQNTVWKAYFGDDPRKIPADMRSQPIKMPVPKCDPANPADCYPDRIVECVLIPDERNRFLGLVQELGKANASPGVTGTRLFLRRRLLIDPYIVSGDLYLCKNCGRGFTSKPGCKYHMQSQVCIIKNKKASETASQMRADIQQRWERERKKPPPKPKPRHTPRSKGPKDLAVYPAIWLTLGFKLLATGPIARHMSAFENKRSLKRAQKPTNEMVQEQSTTEFPNQADKEVLQKPTTEVPMQTDTMHGNSEVSADDKESTSKQIGEWQSPGIETEVDSGDHDFQNPVELLNDLKAKLANFTSSTKKRSRVEVEVDSGDHDIQNQAETSGVKKRSRAKVKKRTATEVTTCDSKSTPPEVQEKSSIEVAPKRTNQRPVIERDVLQDHGLQNPGAVLDGLKASLANMTLGAMYPSVLTSLGFQMNPEPPKKRRVIKRRQRAKKAKPPPPKRPVPPIVDVRVLVKEVESGRYPSMKRIAGDVDHDDICYICKKEGSLVCCDFCSKSVHFVCMRSRFTLPFPEPKDDFMCNHCIQAIMARRNRAEKRRLEKSGATALPSSATVPDAAAATTRLTRELVEGMEYDCVAAQGREVNDLVKLVRDSQIRLQRHSEMVKMNKIRRGLIQSSEQTAAL